MFGAEAGNGPIAERHRHGAPVADPRADEVRVVLVPKDGRVENRGKFVVGVLARDIDAQPGCAVPVSDEGIVVPAIGAAEKRDAFVRRIMALAVWTVSSRILVKGQ